MKILDRDNQTITKLNFQENDIRFQQKRDVDLMWEDGTDKAGIYRAVLEIDYDEKTQNAEAEFGIGDLLIDIIDLTKTEFIKDRITALEVSTQSMWNYQILNVYAELEVNGKKTKSQSVNYAPWQEQTIPIYFDPTGLELGDYEAKITLFYEGRTSQKTFDIKIVRKPLFSLTGYSVYIIVALTIIVVVAILVFIVKKRKLYKSRNKPR